MTDDQTCSKCNQAHARCTAHNRRGGPCNLNPAKGMRVCRLHGGESPQAKLAHKRRELEQAADREVRLNWGDYGEQPVTDPLAELARVAGEIVAFKDVLREQTRALEGVLTYWTDQEYRDAEGEVIRSEAVEQARAIVLAYERAQDRAAKVLATMVKLDIQGRLAAVSEAQAVTMVAAVRAGLAMVEGLEQSVRTQILERIADEFEGVTMPAAPRELLP